MERIEFPLVVPPCGSWLRHAEVVEPEGAGAVVLQPDADTDGARRRDVGAGLRAPAADAAEDQRGAGADLRPVGVVADDGDVARAARGAGRPFPAAIGVAQPGG